MVEGLSLVLVAAPLVDQSRRCASGGDKRSAGQAKSSPLADGRHKHEAPRTEPVANLVQVSSDPAPAHSRDESDLPVRPVAEWFLARLPAAAKRSLLTREDQAHGRVVHLAVAFNAQRPVDA